MNTKAHLPLITLLLLASFASFGAVVLSPALPAIAQYFHVGASKTEMIMVLYLWGYASGQLLYGPLANHWGRKAALMMGIGVALLGNLLALIAPFLHSFGLLVTARFFSAFGASAGLVVGMILIKDVYDEINARRLFSKVIVAFAFVPFIATAIGGSLTHYLGWQANSMVNMIYALILVIFTKRLPETLPRGTRPIFSFRRLLQTYYGLLHQGAYWHLVILFALGSAMSYVFNAIAPVVVIQTWHVSSVVYGWLNIIPSLGIFFSAWVSNYFAAKVKGFHFVILGIILMALSSIFLIVVFAMGLSNLLNLYSAAAILFFGSTLVIPNASMQAISKVKDHATGTSVMNAFVLIMSGLFVNVGGSLIESSRLGLPITLLIISALGSLLIVLPFLGLKAKQTLPSGSRI